MMGVFLAVLAFIGAGAGLLVALPGSQPFVIPPLAIGSAFCLFWARSRETETYNRWFSPVWLRQWTPASGTVEVHFRDAQLARDVALLSGVQTTPEAPADYRAPAGTPPPPAWSGPPPRAFPIWVPFAAALVLLIAGVLEFAQLADAESHFRTIRDHWLVVALYRLGGKYTVLGTFLFGGIVSLAVGVMLWRHRRAKR